jgi:DNA modification methylase
MAIEEHKLQEGDQTELDASELEPHPRNQEIYTNGDISDIASRMRENGFKEEHRILTTEDGRILSGHRRWRAAQEVGIGSVPVEVVGVSSEEEALERLLLANEYREKTPAEKINEAEAWEELERQKAKERKLATQNNDSAPERPNLDEQDQGRTDEKVAEKVGVSKNTYRNGKKVKEIATGERDAPEEVVKVAKEQWDRMQEGEQSFYGAKKQVELKESELEVQEQRKETLETTPTVKESESSELLDQAPAVDLLLTDPPYSTDVDGMEEFVKSWIPDAINAIGDSGMGFIFIGAYANELRIYLNALSDEGVLDRTQVLVWEYKNTLGQTPNDQYKQNWQAVLFIQSDPATDLDAPRTDETWAVQEINAPDARTGQRHHEWQKPLEIVGRFIRHTTDEGDLVVDPFVGTGTTVLKAAELGRRAIGCDIDTEMLETASKRGCEYGPTDS